MLNFLICASFLINVHLIEQTHSQKDKPMDKQRLNITMEKALEKTVDPHFDEKLDATFNKNYGRKVDREIKSESRKPWQDLHFKTEDIIECKMWGGVDHVLLATSNRTVAHIDNSKCGLDINVVEEPWNVYHERKKDEHKICGVIGHSAYPDAIERARSDVKRNRGKCIYYNAKSCNCEHWVNFWTTGKSYSPQMMSGADEFCDAGRKDSINVNVKSVSGMFLIPKEKMH